MFLLISEAVLISFIYWCMDAGHRSVGRSFYRKHAYEITREKQHLSKKQPYTLFYSISCPHSPTPAPFHEQFATILIFV